MSKLNSALLDKAVTDILACSSGETVTVGGEEKDGKKRNFIETIEAQINCDPVCNKRFSGTFKLPSVQRPNLKCCILENAAHCEQADKLNVEDLKKLAK